MIHARPHKSSRLLLIVVFAALLALPLLTLWNIAASELAPKLAVRIGPRLTGVTDPIKWPSTWHDLRDQSWQKGIGQVVNRSNPFTSLFVRLNNELRYALFGYISTPGVLEGRRHQLVEAPYLGEYGVRSAKEAERRAKEFIPLLRDMQDYYRARNKE